MSSTLSITDRQAAERYGVACEIIRRWRRDGDWRWWRNGDIPKVVKLSRNQAFLIERASRRLPSACTRASGNVTSDTGPGPRSHRLPWIISRWTQRLVPDGSTCRYSLFLGVAPLLLGVAQEDGREFWFGMSARLQVPSVRRGLVQASSEGQAALDEFNKRRPQLPVLKIKLPRMDRLQQLRQ